VAKVAKGNRMTADRTDRTLAGNREAMDRFLEKLRASGNVRLSCRAAGKFV